MKWVFKTSAPVNSVPYVDGEKFILAHQMVLSMLQILKQEEKYGATIHIFL